MDEEVFPITNFKGIKLFEDDDTTLLVQSKNNFRSIFKILKKLTFSRDLLYPLKDKKAYKIEVYL